jgi:carbon storage regulator
MLVLTRKIGQELVIAGDIRVTVVSVNGPKVRLGITAPPAVGVLRQELVNASRASPAAPAVETTRT